MLTALDHIVIAVRDLAAARRDFESLGFTVVPGGRHPEGSHNALIGLADGAYIELLAFAAPSPEHRWWAALLRGGGLVDFCLASDDLRADAAALRRAGVDMGDPEPGARARPDGYQVRWLLAKARGRHRGVAPFLIHDETPRAERVPQQSRHGNRVTGIATVTVAVTDLDTVSPWYAAALGRAGRPALRPELGARGARFAVGSHTVELLEPVGSDGDIARWLQAHGPSPWGATLVAGTGSPGPLDPRLTHAARLLVA